MSASQIRVYGSFVYNAEYNGYDCGCGLGGVLTVSPDATDFLFAANHDSDIVHHPLSPKALDFWL